MSESQASPILEPVAETPPTQHEDARAVEHAQALGLRPPTRRGRSSRSITEVIIDLDFLTREQVDAAVEEAKATGRRPPAVRPVISMASPRLRTSTKTR